MLSLLFDFANRPETPNTETNLKVALNLPNELDAETALVVYRRMREYIASGRNNVWKWYISNLVQPLRLAAMPAPRLVGNPPWVVYNAMSADRQDAFRARAQDRGVWASSNLATQNDLAATFAATCVDFYLQADGKFGFVLPYAALRARQWQPFRSGNWSSKANAERGTHVDLSKDAWDLSAVKEPPFLGSAHASVIFGERRPANKQAPQLKSLAKVRQQAGSNINAKMSWREVKPLLSYTYRKEYPIARSEAYADNFRNGATLFPLSLMAFDEADAEWALGKVRFRTQNSKGVWKKFSGRDGVIEERYAKPAVFSKHLVPFGSNGALNIIAPFSDDDSEILRELTQGEGRVEFNAYWARANADWVETKSQKSPASLALRIDHVRNLSAQLKHKNGYKIIYNSSGSVLTSSVINSDMVVGHTLYWLVCEEMEVAHYLSAIFNARCLSEVFKEHCRASDRHFMLLPVQNLPIPEYDANDEHHASLAAQSILAHERVAALIAERAEVGRKTSRNDVLKDAALQPIFASIDACVRAILPDYCSE